MSLAEGTMRVNPDGSCSTSGPAGEVAPKRAKLASIAPAAASLVPASDEEPVHAPAGLLRGAGMLQPFLAANSVPLSLGNSSDLTSMGRHLANVALANDFGYTGLPTPATPPGAKDTQPGQLPAEVTPEKIAFNDFMNMLKSVNVPPQVLALLNHHSLTREVAVDRETQESLSSVSCSRTLESDFESP